ncbi:hypothetical protein EDEG_01920 [Edhazardia aedis USNM 41457]|uniref:Uncharacterized protein n=1 Tax=Edhazardia aedis (strain USNM 41457) TaxID=1003232 RepID=J9D7M1_EDHAE|nr:hypothetical protein EDEG_01920 [Edhazardia aedis USNM 41457]|eukprot:EJW03791.1 hypothetical protein EDEG_01920 [Edhazardia aedis USNM 41457]
MHLTNISLYAFLAIFLAIRAEDAAKGAEAPAGEDKKPKDDKSAKNPEDKKGDKKPELASDPESAFKTPKVETKVTSTTTYADVLKTAKQIPKGDAFAYLNYFMSGLNSTFLIFNTKTKELISDNVETALKSLKVEDIAFYLQAPPQFSALLAQIFTDSNFSAWREQIYTYVPKIATTTTTTKTEDKPKDDKKGKDDKKPKDDKGKDGEKPEIAQESPVGPDGGKPEGPEALPDAKAGKAGKAPK